MCKQNDEDIKEVEEWIQSQKFLPKDLSKTFICTFLTGCQGDKARAKTVLGNYFYARQSIPEIFTKRDPCLKENVLAWKASCFVPLKGEHNGCRIYLGAALNTENYNFGQFVKQVFMCFDLKLQNDDWGNGDRMMILSYDKIKYQHLASYNIYITRKMAECERDKYLPGKLKAVHNVHIPPFIKKIQEKFSPFISPEDMKVMLFHKTLKSLHKSINPNILPIELGGNAGPIKQMAEDWYETLKAHRNFFIQEEDKRMREARAKI